MFPFRDRPVDYSIEGAGGKFRVRIKDADGQEHVRVFETRSAAREYVRGLQQRRADGPIPPV
jgi:hypothetical protein